MMNFVNVCRPLAYRYVFFSGGQVLWQQSTLAVSVTFTTSGTGSRLIGHSALTGSRGPAQRLHTRHQATNPERQAQHSTQAILHPHDTLQQPAPAGLANAPGHDLLLHFLLGIQIALILALDVPEAGIEQRPQ